MASTTTIQKNNELEEINSKLVEEIEGMDIAWQCAHKIVSAERLGDKTLLTKAIEEADEIILRDGPEGKMLQTSFIYQNGKVWSFMSPEPMETHTVGHAAAVAGHQPVDDAACDVLQAHEPHRPERVGFVARIAELEREVERLMAAQKVKDDKMNWLAAQMDSKVRIQEGIVTVLKEEREAMNKEGVWLGRMERWIRRIELSETKEENDKLQQRGCSTRKGVEGGKQSNLHEGAATAGRQRL